MHYYTYIKTRKKNDMTRAYIETATPKQIDYLQSLMRDRDVDALTVSRIDDAIAAHSLTKQLASECIRDALQCAKRPLAQERVNLAMAELTHGMYRKDGTIFKVQIAVHGSGRLYAKRLVLNSDGGVHFEYAAGAVRMLTIQDRMSIEDAKAFGVLYGTCCVCGRTLTDEVSIANGIGPVCAKRYF